MKKLAAITMALALTISATPSTFAQIQTVDEAADENMYTIQIEQQINGVVDFIYNYEMNIKGDDGKNYAVILSYFTLEEIEKMGIKEGSKVFVEGQTLPKEYDQSFAYYKLSLPTTLSEEELVKIEHHFNKMREYDLVEDLEGSMAEWDKIYKILEPHYYMDWEPTPFEDYLSWFPYELTTEELEKLQTIYQEANFLIANGKYAEGQEKMIEFYELLDQYYQAHYVRPTFAEFVEQLELEIKEEDLVKLEKLYDEIGQLENSENTSQLEKLWSEFHLIIEEYHLANYEPTPFEEFVGYMEFSISDSDLEKIRPLYEQSIQLEKERKWEESSEVWQEIHEVLAPYYEKLRPIYFQASQVVVQ